MDEPGTVFYLVPINEGAHEIVNDDANCDRRRVDPNNISKQYLRIALDQPAKIPGRLATFGRMPFMNDVILRSGNFSKADQCYFDFHPTTGELLLHDISKNDDTQLCTPGAGNIEQIGRSPRQCVVQLDKEWIFQIGPARFDLIPRRTPSPEDKASFAAERVAFVRQIPDEFRTHQWTLESLQAVGVQSHPSTTTARSYNIRRLHPDRLKSGEEIRHARRGDLGSGGQGTVDVVVDLHTGDHYARKTLTWKVIPEWRINNESDFKARVLREVDLVKKARHDHIVPYLHHQGWEMGETLEIFMPIYEGNLLNLLKRLKHGNAPPEARRVRTATMLHQMLLALDHVHKQGIIHRDIKPANILYRGDDFFLTDFGIAKVMDSSRTMAGTKWYAAPEVQFNRQQTPKVDIYSLGVTVVECLGELPPERQRPPWKQWHQDIQAALSEVEPRMTSMLADAADERPTAQQLLQNLFQQSSDPSLQSLQVHQDKRTMMICSTGHSTMDWTRTRATALRCQNSRPAQRDDDAQPLELNPSPDLSSEASPNRRMQLRSGYKLTARPRSVKSVKSVRSVRSEKSTNEKRATGGQHNDRPPRRGRYAPPQSGGVLKRTSSRISRRSRAESGLKAEEMRALRVT